MIRRKAMAVVALVGLFVASYMALHKLGMIGTLACTLSSCELVQNSRWATLMGLHGHNYRVRVTVEGALNKEAWFVFDFVELKGIMKRLCDEIDHLVLLPLESDRIKVVEDGEIVRVSVDGKPRYTFPRRDCALLPIPNTTVEMLAKLLTTRLKTTIGPEASKPLTAIEMEVEENFGQTAVYRENLT